MSDQGRDGREGSRRGAEPGLVDQLRGLGQALLDVLRAELAALGEDFRRSGRDLAAGLGLLGGAAAVLFWTAGLAAFTLVAVLAIWFRLWLAALLVLAGFATVTAVLAWLGISRLRRLESPLEDVRRRAADHLDWWQNRLLGGEPPPSPRTAQAIGDQEEDLP